MKIKIYPQNTIDLCRAHRSAGCKEPCPEHKIDLSIAIDGFGKGSKSCFQNPNDDGSSDFCRSARRRQECCARRHRPLCANAADGKNRAVRRGCGPKRRSRRCRRAHALEVRHACRRLALLRIGLAPSHILILKTRLNFQPHLRTVKNRT